MPRRCWTMRCCRDAYCANEYCSCHIRYGSALNLNLHFFMLILDGVYLTVGRQVGGKEPFISAKTLIHPQSILIPAVFTSV